jgi:hypothetical protein
MSVEIEMNLPPSKIIRVISVKELYKKAMDVEKKLDKLFEKYPYSIQYLGTINKFVASLLSPTDPLAIIVQGINKKNNSNNNSANEEDSGTASNPHYKLQKSYNSRLKGLFICERYIDEKLNKTDDPEEQKMLNGYKDKINDKREDLIKEMNKNLSEKDIENIMKEQQEQSMHILSLMQHNKKEKGSRSI